MGRKIYIQDGRQIYIQDGRQIQDGPSKKLENLNNVLMAANIYRYHKEQK